LFVSLEMTEVELTYRMQSSETETENRNIKNANLRDSEYQQLCERSESINDWKGIVKCKGGATVNYIRAQAQRMILAGGLSSIFVDYLQIMDVGDGNRDTELGNITRGLKQLALDLNVSVVIGCQIGRSAERRGGTKRPQLSDLRESGNIENDSDVVMTLYIPDRYNFDKDEDGNPTNYGDTMVLCEVDILKNRHGELGMKQTVFHQKYQRFYGIESVLSGFEKPLIPIRQAENNSITGDVPF